MKILVTGFKPFLGAKINPSEIISLQLTKTFSEVSSLILPVEFGYSFEVLKSHLVDNSYDYLIILGQASGRSKISLEKIALNWVQSQNKDESGRLPPVGFIMAKKPLALMSQFPIDEVFTELKKQNLPVEISFSAGAFVCNDLYYRTLTEYNSLKTVFIHVPLIQDMELSEQLNVLNQTIKIINAWPMVR